MSRVPRFVTADEAVAAIPDGGTVATDGFTLLGVAEEVFEAVERRFLATGTPRGLTVVAASGQSGNELGFEHFAHEGLVGRVVGSHWGLQPRMSRFLRDNGAEAVCLPQGQISTLYRAIAARRAGNLSRIGIDTFVDPERDAGRINEAAAAAPPYVESVHIDGERHLLYRSFPVDVAIIRATSVDPDGNCSIAEEAATLDQLAIAQAAKASGGIVIVQAKYAVDRGAIAPREVMVPGQFVDLVVVTTDAQRYHRQSKGFPFDARLVSAGAVPADPAEFVLPEDRLAIGLRAVRDLSPGEIINIGTGIPGDVISAALAEAGLAGQVTVTVEAGTHGGAPLGGTDFGATLHPTAIIPQSHQFDFYDGGGLDATFMGVGEVDRFGNVNVSLLGERVIGCGGFIDITQSTRRIYFCFVLGGRHSKFVRDVGHLTFNGTRAHREGQEVWYVTERAVFRLTGSGIRLVELRSGYDLHDDVLALIPFDIEVDSDALAVAAAPPVTIPSTQR
ncbi:CoA-transferase [Jiangella asiatica]|uniref:Acyl CoA:acetate/3-ketoacid CoA transferase n=1 Tax=Jiangella asiatica TaxID=2530372 RepID=A0A4R5DBD0_9ACTN|nr:CoA-transferase [Jiangella asiatica]TDE09300.1 acyl CoA:acetate/3-ketoacid CoA transferase [Jiangella asiatica]